MKHEKETLGVRINQRLVQMGINMRAKLIMIFLCVQVLPLVLLTVMAWQQVQMLSSLLRDISVEDASAALNDSAVENIERMSTDTAQQVATFLYERDDDILYLATMEPTLENYRYFCENRLGLVMDRGEWALSEDGSSWVRTDSEETVSSYAGVSTNIENTDMDGFHYREPESYTYSSLPLYDEITFVGLDGVELVKYVTPNSSKVNYPFSQEKRDVSNRENTYVKAETYFAALGDLAPGDIYVSDVIGAYVGSNYIGMYTPDVVAEAADARGYEITYDPEAQAYAGKENPDGQRFEGIVRWATPVADDAGNVVGYVTFALNHDHIMEFVDHITPMNERYTDLPSAYEGNYAFIWDYQCRNICHPRHHSIVGYDPETGLAQVPWLESSIYEGWQESGLSSWLDYVANIPTFFMQSRSKTPTAELTQAGLVGLDGRYLNNAPQCTGWMDLTGDGGSGSFYILWSGIYKLNTAAAIPYYTGQYAPSEDNNYSKRGFGFVAIGAGLEDFTAPATLMEGRLIDAAEESQYNIVMRLVSVTSILIVIVVLIAIWVASSITGKLTKMIAGISRFRSGERQFRYHDPVKDEFGALSDCFDDMADSIVDSVKNALSITDMDKKIIYMNDKSLEFCNTTLEAVAGTDYALTSVYPTDSPYDPIRALKEGRESDICYLEKIDRYMKGQANYLLDKNANRIGYIIETTDVTDMVREQLRVERQKSLLDSVFGFSPDLIWYMDEKGAYYTVNPRFASICGKDPEEFVGKTALDILPSYIANGFNLNDRKAIEASSPVYSEEHIVFADGHEEVLDSVRTPLYDTNGQLSGILGFARDVTIRVKIDDELRTTQMELERAVEDANRANQHKGDFLARMSHEIRTPMNAIIGLASIARKELEEQLLQHAELDGVKRNIDQIEASSQHLLGLLNDILDLSKIEAGKIELAEEVSSLPKLVETVQSIIRPRCAEKSIQFETHRDPFAAEVFSLDALRLRQVLINLLGNSVKFTPEHGRIDFSVFCKERKDGKTLTEFVVTDTGIGIAPDYLNKVFESFEQGGSGISKSHGGTGLGLAISRSIVQLFGGDIEVESQLGEGSTFRFAVWLKETQAPIPETVRVTDVTDKFTGKRLLLTDDVTVNRIVVASMLSKSGIAIDEAADGAEALEKFKSSPEGYYDIILMDIQMPNMNGYDACAAIRTLDRADAKAVPIIAQTAFAFQDDIQKALSFGMTAHISKPVEMTALYETLYRFLVAE